MDDDLANHRLRQSTGAQRASEPITGAGIGASPANLPSALGQSPSARLAGLQSASRIDVLADVLSPRVTSLAAPSFYAASLMPFSFVSRLE